MGDTRPADLAGTWYPETAEECARFLDEVPAATARGLPEKSFAAIVPHAGWVYSGAVAQQALSALAAANPEPGLVVIFGGHLGPRDHTRIFLDGAWSTPFGPLPIASDLAQDLSMAVEHELETPDEYFDDNAIEVVMPMIRHRWPTVQVLTVGVAPTGDAGKIGAEVVSLAKKRGFTHPVIVGSTDLTHYGPNYDFLPHGRGKRGLEWVKTKNDPEMIAAIQALDAPKVLATARASRNACCPGAVAATIAAAGKLGAKRAATVSYTTSFDAKPRESEPTSFVGYAGMVLGI